MPVVTISRLTGSGGAQIGQHLATRLGASYLDREIIQVSAQRLGIPDERAAEHDERGDSFAERLARVLWVSSSSLESMSGPPPSVPFESTTDAFARVTRQLVLQAAATGNAVIFGHGAQFILADQPQVLHVRFVAPLPDRVARVMQREGIGATEAERRVRAEDQRRAGHIRQYFHADWNALDPFHLILNTSRLDESACIRLILDALEELKNKGRS